MATRALINFVEREDGVSFSEHPGVDKIHTQIYNHYDGYPSGLGVTLANYLQDFKVVNGLGNDQELVANGMGCLAAQTVKYLKDGPGNIYLHKPARYWLFFNLYTHNISFLKFLLYFYLSLY